MLRGVLTSAAPRGHNVWRGTLRKSRVLAVASIAALSLVAAACGDSGTKAASTTTAAKASGTGGSASGTGGSGATTTAAGCKLDKAPKLIGLAEKPPEGPNAINDFSNGWDLALDGLTICGQKPDYERLPMSPTDAAAAKTNVLSALDKKADVMFGIPSSATILGVAADIKAGGTPIIFSSAGVTTFVGAPNSIGSEWGFVIRPRNVGAASAQAEYLVKDLGKKKVGLICATQAFGSQSCDALKPVIEAAGGTIVSRQDVDQAATNLTTQILALKSAGVDGVLTFIFPNSLVVGYNQAAENGLNVPIFGGASAGLAIATKNVTAAGLKNVWGADDCAPTLDARAKDFLDKYKAKFAGAIPGYAAAEAYDEVMFAKAAIEKAGKLDHKAIADAMRTVALKGVCADYSADAGQGLNRAVSIESFDAAGLPKIEKTVAAPAPTGGG